MPDFVERTINYIVTFGYDGFVAALIVGAVAPLLGTLLVMRRMPFVAVAVPQMANAGLAFAFWVHGLAVIEGTSGPTHPADLEDPSRVFQIVVSAVFVALGLIFLSLLGRRSRDNGMHAIVAYLLSFASAEVFFLESPYEDQADQLLHHGRLLSVLPEGRYVVTWTCAATLAVLLAFRRSFRLTALDPDQARINGSSPSLWLLATLVVLGAFAALLVPQVGPEVVLAMTIIPPSILRRAAPSLSSYGPLCSLSGVTGAVGAYALAVSEDWPVGPAVVVAVLATSTTICIALLVIERIRSATDARKITARAG